MQHYRRHWPVLMLVPVAMTYQWQSELLKFSGEILKEKEIFIAKKVSVSFCVNVFMCMFLFVGGCVFTWLCVCVYDRV